MTATGPLQPLFEPRSIAVIGASASPAKAGHQMLSSLQDFPGSIYPINPGATNIRGLKSLSSVSEVPERLDLAVLTIPAPAVPRALRESAQAGVRAAMVCSGGFAESGPEGAELQDEVRRIACDSGMRVLGPNTSGFVNPRIRVFASFVPAVSELRAGPIAILAQSGGIMHALAFLAHNDGAGLRLGVGLGNAADIGFADVLDHLATNGSTEVIALHLEGEVDGRSLFEAVERVTERVPVVALKAGASDVGEFARSHTGALIGNRRLIRSALVQAGAVIVDDTTELVDAARALASARLPATADPGVGVVTGQAGPGLLVADGLRASGVNVPELSPATRERLATLLQPLTYQRNPIDTGRPAETFAKVISVVGEDPAIDALGVYALHEPAALDPVASLGANASDGVPVLFATGGPAGGIVPTLERLREAGIASYESPERLALALRALASDARSRHRRSQPGTAPEPRGRGIRLSGDPLDEHQAKQVVECLGVRTPMRLVCETRDEVLGASKSLDPPVVLKVLDSSVAHKSEARGVITGIRTPEEMREALREIAPSDRYLVEEMAPPGIELIVGGRRDASFGASVLVGLGGVAAEAMDDAAVRLTPVTRGDALEMLAELRGRSLLDGFRGMPKADPESLAGVIMGIGELIAIHSEIVEIDINPLRVTANGPLALDALIVLEGDK
jgi:acetate---CoA ligase (ADP-forming)